MRTEGSTRSHGSEGVIEALIRARDSQQDPVARALLKQIEQRVRGGEDDPFRLGRFTVLETIGRGGMGTVFAAYDPRLDRKVAIKALRRADSHDALIHEGRALARLSHPNVVGVHEIAMIDDDAFVVMEHVPGLTLRRWLAAAPRSTRDALAMLLGAGRGLAAAHDAGLVHHDFKPDNVIIGEDGRPRVVDFGLAQLDATEEPLASSLSGASSSVTSPTGCRGGTLGYMAPERGEGQRGDARSDQFSFCVSVWEALHGALPFPRAPADERHAAIERGVGSAPWSAAVGLRERERLRRVLARGLAARPERRYPSMDALLEALTPPRRAAGRWLAVVVSVALAGSLGILVARSFAADAPAPCQAAREELAAVWGPGAASRVRDAFARVDVPYAADSAARAVELLDDYAAAWEARHTAVCEATWKHGAQSEDLLDRRMTCLAQRRVALEAAAQSFARADATDVRNAIRAASSLPAVETCEHMTAALVPEDAQVRASVSRVREASERSAVHLELARYEHMEDETRALLEQAEALAFTPLTAELLLLRGRALDRLSRSRDAVAPLERAAEAALEAGHDRVLFQAAYELVMLAADDLADPALGERWLWVADAAARRLKDNDFLAWSSLARARLRIRQHRLEDALEALSRADEHAGASGERSRRVHLRLLIDTAHASVLIEQGHREEALAIHTRSLQRARAYYGEADPRTARSTMNVAIAYTHLADNARAREYYQRALDIGAASVGETSALVADALRGLGICAFRQGDYEQSARHARRTIAIYEQLQGPESWEVASELRNLAITLMFAGARDEAYTTAQRALEIARARSGERSQEAGDVLLTVANGALGLRRYDEALARFEEARGILTERLGPQHPLVGIALTGKASALHHNERREEALRLFEQAREIHKCDVEPDEENCKLADISIAELAVSLGQLERARAAMASARRFEQSEIEELRLEMVRATLAWAEGDRRRARALASEARARLATSDEETAAHHLEDVDAWLRRHR